MSCAKLVRDPPFPLGQINLLTHIPGNRDLRHGGSSIISKRTLPSPSVCSTVSSSPSSPLSKARSDTIPIPRSSKPNSVLSRLAKFRLPVGRYSNSHSAATSDDGKFERSFVIVQQLGGGTFATAFKVRYRDASDDFTCYAIKRGIKRFESLKDKQRQAEESTILRRLTGSETHPNIIRYIDSWNEDNRFYLQTELCELGNFAAFLNDFGQQAERLDEGRVWKCLASISSVCPVDRSLHDTHKHPGSGSHAFT